MKVNCLSNDDFGKGVWVQGGIRVWHTGQAGEWTGTELKPGDLLQTGTARGLQTDASLTHTHTHKHKHKHTQITASALGGAGNK